MLCSQPPLSPAICCGNGQLLRRLRMGAVTREAKQAAKLEIGHDIAEQYLL